MRGLLAMALGTFSLGIAEFVMMGLLPYIAKYFGVSIAQAGHAISVYALGVMLGAFLLSVLRHLTLRHIMLVLASLMLAGSCLATWAPSFWTLVAARFIMGIPHGCFFGAWSIIAQRLAQQGKGSSAVSIVVTGMTIANLVGVPLGTYLAHIFSWRDVFYVIALLNTGVLLALFTWLPDVGGLKDTGFKEQFVFLKSPAPWLILAATAFGNGGIFVMFSYLSPLLTDWSGLNVANVPWVMMLAGLAMVLFNLLSGQLCDRFTPGKVAFAFQSLAVLGLLLLALTGSKLYLAISLICFCSGVLFALSAPQQIAILQTAQGGMLLGAALIQAAFNLGNALGATVGGFPFSLHWPYYSVPLIGALVACLGAISLYLYSRFYEPTLEPAPSRA